MHCSRLSVEDLEVSHTLGRKNRYVPFGACTSSLEHVSHPRQWYAIPLAISTQLRPALASTADLPIPCRYSSNRQSSSLLLLYGLRSRRRRLTVARVRTEYHGRYASLMSSRRMSSERESSVVAISSKRIGVENGQETKADQRLSRSATSFLIVATVILVAPGWHIGVGPVARWTAWRTPGHS